MTQSEEYFLENEWKVGRGELREQYLGPSAHKEDLQLSASFSLPLCPFLLLNRTLTLLGVSICPLVGHSIKKKLILSWLPGNDLLDGLRITSEPLASSWPRVTDTNWLRLKKILLLGWWRDTLSFFLEACCQLLLGVSDSFVTVSATWHGNYQ